MNSRAVASTVTIVVTLVLLVSANVTLCPLAGLSGVSCPSCGLTRATIALLEGDVARAAVIHPGVFVVLPYLFAFVLGQCRPFRHRSARERALGRRLLAVTGALLLVALVAFWVARFFGAWGGPVPVKRWVDLGSFGNRKATNLQITR
ncbi:MAG: DUF2752 domain-containing protein [Polyangiaceae bacterium]